MESGDEAFERMMYYPKPPPSVTSSSLSMDRRSEDVQNSTASVPPSPAISVSSIKRKKDRISPTASELSIQQKKAHISRTASESRAQQGNGLAAASELKRPQTNGGQISPAPYEPDTQQKKLPASPTTSEPDTQLKNGTAPLATSERKAPAAHKPKTEQERISKPRTKQEQDPASQATNNSRPKQEKAPASPATNNPRTEQEVIPATRAASKPKTEHETIPANPATSKPKTEEEKASRPASEPKTKQERAPATPAPSKPKTEKEKASRTASEPKTKQEKAPAMPAKSKTKPKKELSEEEEWLRAIEEKFTSIAGEDRVINYDEFRKAIDSKEEIFIKSYFKLFDDDDSGEIGLDEFMESLRKISNQTADDKLRFLFSIFDTDGNGEISPDELKVALRACMTESSLKMTDDKMDQLVAALMKSADVDGDGVITYEELKAQFEKYPMLLDNLAVSPSNWLKLHKKPTKPNPLKVIKTAVVNMYSNNKPLLGFLIVHHLIFAACFAISVYRYRKSNGWVMLARGCGMSLNYHCAMLALSMARRSLTFFRNTPIGPYLAVDDHIELHKMLGTVTIVLGLVHTVAHLANIGVMVAGGHALSFAQILFTHLSGIGYFYGTAYPSGVLLTLIIIVIGFCSSPYVRRAGLFEFFYRTHLLYIPFWVLTLLHGPIFWIWFLAPGLMIFCEHCYSHAIHQVQKADPKGFFTTEVNLLPSKVIHLVVTRPKSFKFNAGDYVFIQIPSISKWEWHPFSISSAPEEEGILWIHIRTMTGWTKRLYDLFDKGDYVNSIEEYEEEDCWKCGNAHDPPRGGKCTKPRKKGYCIATRHSMLEAPSYGSMEPVLLGDRDDFPNKEDYMMYLEAAKEDLDHEAEAAKLRDQILYLAGAKATPPPNNNTLKHAGSGSLTRTRKRKPVKTSADLFRQIRHRQDSRPDAVRNLPNGGRSYQDRRKCYIEGPFGSAAVRMGDTNHAVLVAAGIGVTPFASVLQSLVTQHSMAREENTDNTPNYQNSNRLKKIDFIWVNRKADDFDWFLSLLTQLEMEESRQGDFDSFMDMHLFMTAAKSSNDLKGVGLQMALELVHQEDSTDMITGLKTRTQAGRPNWKKLFQQFKDENKGQVHVYYCGGPAVAKVVKKEADNIGFQFSLSL